MPNRRTSKIRPIVSHGRIGSVDNTPKIVVIIWAWIAICLDWSRCNNLGSSSIIQNDPLIYVSSIVPPLHFWTTVEAWGAISTQVQVDRWKQRRKALSPRCRSVTRDTSDNVCQEAFKHEEDRHHHQCSICSEQFSSRNALFRHIRNGHSPRREGNAVGNPMVKYTVAISVGYLRGASLSSSSSISQFAGDQIQAAIQNALRKLHNFTTSDAHHVAAIVSQTQASVARSRPNCLGQEDDCASAEDIVIIKAVVPKGILVPSPENPDLHTRQSRKNFLLHHLGNSIPEFLSLSNRELGHFDAVSNSSINIRNNIMQLHGIRILDDDDYVAEDDVHNVFPTETEAIESPVADMYPSSYRKIHAEQSCTQHIYHGLIPVEWLPNSTDIIHWYHTSYHEPARHLRAPIPSTIRSLKEILRSMESTEQIRPNADSVDRKVREFEANTVRDSATKLASINAAAKGRYGALAYRIPRYWHNYADPSLRISPNYDPAYRVVDRARIVDFVWINSTKSNGIPDDSSVGRLYVLCSVMGDEFLQQQVRRMLGTAVAMINEWLPIQNFLDQSIDPGVILETPVIPSTLVYRTGSRFHWNEVDGQRLFCFANEPSPFSANACVLSPNDPISWIHTQLSLSHRLSGHDLDAWFINFRDVVCPRIREQIYNRFDKPRPKWYPSTIVQIRKPPVAYFEVLNILRSIMSKNLWPSTSVARSSVIAPSSLCGNSPATENPNPATSGGSFTVVNTRTLRDLAGPMEQSNYPIPKANILFPELTMAVFKLEEWIIASGAAHGTLSPYVNDGSSPNAVTSAPQTPRQPSTHCAINCNAQFLPHVDSGRGLGQSISMIVGLGDYVGGEIVVEQISYPIRYQPLEFDGWNLRHWTNPFAGPDRYSLVWFTPATCAISD